MSLTVYGEGTELPLHFAFRGNDILTLSAEGRLPWESRLPDGGCFSRLAREYRTDSPHLRLFSERDCGYSALMLDDGAEAPGGLSFIPLREFFWLTKTEEEQRKGLPSRLGMLAARAHGFLCLLAIYRFCPRCGSPLIFDVRETAMRCTNPSCGRLDFPHIEPAVIVLVRRGVWPDEELLLVKNRNFQHDYYGCVSGFVEMGESIENAAAREVMEETGIRIQNLRYVGSQGWPFPDQLMLAFTADYKSGEIARQEEELIDAAWFRRDALPSIPYPGSVAYSLINGFF